MNSSQSVKELAAALAKAQAEFPPIPRNKTVRVTSKRTGSTYTFAYAPLDTIMERIKPVLAANGLAFIQSMSGESLTTTILHKSGEWVQSEALPIRVDEAGSQALGSAITYARRYALTAMFGLVTDEDDDGNTADGNQATVTSTAPKKFSSKSVSEDDWDKLTEDERKWLQGIVDLVRVEYESKGPVKALATWKEQALAAHHEVAGWGRFTSKERSDMKKAKEMLANG